MSRARVRRRAAVAVVLTLLGTVTAACSSGTTTTSSDKPIQVVSSLIPSSLDPADALSTADGIAGSNFYVTLVRYGKIDAAAGFPADDPTKIEPYLASSWTVSDDGKTYDFTLKPGLTFGSGVPVDAKAVAYSFERLLKTPGAYYINVGIDGLIKKVEATDDYTVRFTLAQAQPTVLAAWASAYAPIVDPTVVPTMPEGWLSSHEAGSGPFELKAYTPGQSLNLVRRPGFEEWAGWTTKSKEVDVSFVGDDSTLLLRARAGADVVIGLSNQSADSLGTGTKNVQVVDFQAPITEELLLNWNQKPFDSLAVRKALTLAVPYDDLYKGPGAQSGKRYYGPIPPNLPDYDAELGAPIDTNVEQAKQILTDAGVATPVKIALTVDQGSAVEQQMAQIIQSQVKDAGFEVTIRVLTSAQYSKVIFADGFQAVLRGEAPAVADPGFYLGYAMAYKQPGGLSNPGSINIPEADKLLAQARRTVGDQPRAALYDQITKVWNAQAPSIPLFTTGQPVALSDSLKAFDYTLGYSQAMYDWGRE